MAKELINILFEDSKKNWDKYSIDGAFLDKDKIKEDLDTMYDVSGEGTLRVLNASFGMPVTIYIFAYTTSFGWYMEFALKQNHVTKTIDLEVRGM